MAGLLLARTSVQLQARRPGLLSCGRASPGARLWQEDYADRTGKASASADAVLSVLRRAGTFAPGTFVGAGVYVSSRQVWAALLACVLWPPAVATGKVAAEWIELLRPSRRLRRPQRRGS